MKPPYRTDGLGLASTTDPSTWSTLEDALVALMNGGGFAGLGIVFTKSDRITGGDVDYSVDSAEARAVIEQFKGTYCEESPSGRLHVLALGELPPGAGNRRDGYELYSSGRYFTFTGKHIPGTALELTPQQDAINWFADTLIGRNGVGHAPPRGGGDGHVPPGGGNGHDSHSGCADGQPDQPQQQEQPEHRLVDEELFNRIARSRDAEKFRRLMARDMAGIPLKAGSVEPDWSVADKRLCDLLAFWTSGDADQMERVWGRSKLSERPKWEQVNYRRRTIAAALNYVKGRWCSGAAEGLDHVAEEDHRAPATPLLPEAFWEATKTLRRIRAVARHRLIIPDALLGNLLARTGGLVPHTLQLRSERKVGPPSLFCAITGSSGAGKSSVADTSRFIIPCPHYLGDNFDNDGKGLGSGEGLLGMFLDWNAEKKRNVQIHHNAFIYVDEGSLFESLGARDGSTTSPHLMTAFTGGHLSTPNASNTTRRSVRDYNLGVVANLTYKAAQHFLARSSDGFPQRFLWFGARDPGATGDAPFADCEIVLPEEGGMVEMAPEIDAEVIALRVARMQLGSTEDDPDAHATWVRCRVAMAFMLWDDPKRRQIERQEWDLARIVTTNSAAVREHIIELNRRAQQEVEAERTAVRINVAQKLKHADTAIPRVALNLAKRVWNEESGRIGRNALKKRGTSRDKCFFDEAVDYAKDQRWVVDDGIAGLAKGSKTPR